MLIVKRINNDAVVCMDAAGNQVVALGRNLSGAKIGEELNLKQAEHTFYDVDTRYLDLIRDLSLEYLELSAQIASVARSLLSYELSPNLEVALADHIQFAVQRMREHIYLAAPMTYDLQQNYPLEFKIAQYALRQIREAIGVELPRNEATGIAMCLVNSAYTGSGAAQAEAQVREQLLEDITRAVEATMGVRVDREGFGFARFATHVQYLMQRVAVSEDIQSENSGLYAQVAADNPRAAACVDAVCALLTSAFPHELTEEEKLYLILHINRICTRSDADGTGAANAGAAANAAGATNTAPVPGPSNRAR